MKTIAIELDEIASNEMMAIACAVAVNCDCVTNKIFFLYSLLCLFAVVDYMRFFGVPFKNSKRNHSVALLVLGSWDSFCLQSFFLYNVLREKNCNNTYLIVFVCFFLLDAVAGEKKSDFNEIKFIDSHLMSRTICQAILMELIN